MVESRQRVRRRQTLYTTKYQTKTCTPVANVTAIFPSHSGIVWFVKDALGDALTHLEVDLPFCTTRLSLHLRHMQRKGVPDLVPCSGRHTEGHHLIRYLAPENAKDKALPTEEQLTVIDCRLDGMQAQPLHRPLVAAAPGNAAQFVACHAP